MGVECLHLRLSFQSLELTESVALEPEHAQPGVLLEVLDLSNTLSRGQRAIGPEVCLRVAQGRREITTY